MLGMVRRNILIKVKHSLPHARQSRGDHGLSQPWGHGNANAQLAYQSSPIKTTTNVHVRLCVHLFRPQLRQIQKADCRMVDEPLCKRKEVEEVRLLLKPRPIPTPISNRYLGSHFGGTV